MKILYVRGNLYRKLKYQVTTIIYQLNDRKVVRKYAGNSKAQPHLLHLKNVKKTLSKILPKNILLPEILDYKSNYIEFEYINLPSLESLIEKTIINHQFELTKDYLHIFKKTLDGLPKKTTNSYENKQFIEIFDPLKNYQSKLKEKCISHGILDLNLDNWIFNSKNNKIYLIDWEWTFDFPISLSFATFRSLFYLSFKLQSLIATFCSIDFPCYEVFDNFYIPKIWWDMFSFSQGDIEKFLFYEYNFQNSVNIIKVDFKKINIFKEKKLVKQQISPNLDSYIQNIISQKLSETEDYKIEFEQTKKEIAETKIKNQKLEKQIKEIAIENQKLKNQIKEALVTLDIIKSAKFFKLWQGYCNIKDKILKKKL